MDAKSTPEGRRSVKLLFLSLAGVPFLVSSLQRVPNGHVGVVQNIFGNCRPYVMDESAPFFIVPLYEKNYPFRIWPIRKRLVQEFVTKDNKVVEAIVQLRLRAKVYYAQEIFLRMGQDFARLFLEQEVSLDTEHIVSEHTYDELLADSDSPTALIAQELISRTREAACFCRLELLDMTVLFRDPLDAP